MVKFDFSGKTAVVIGGASGIGLTLSETFLKSSANVVVGDLDREAIQKTSKRKLFSKKKEKTALFEMDATVETEVNSIMKLAVKKFGTIDVLVCCAGIASRTEVLSLSKEHFERVLKVNLTSVFLCSKEAAKIMEKANGGSIINISSILGSTALPGRAAYCASKGAVIQLSKAMALEWADKKIRVNSICPGFTETPLTATHFENKEVLKLIKDRTPLKRFAQPEEIVGGIMFLASEQASFITGTSLFVDGGWTAW